MKCFIFLAAPSCRRTIVAPDREGWRRQAEASSASLWRVFLLVLRQSRRRWIRTEAAELIGTEAAESHFKKQAGARRLAGGKRRRPADLDANKRQRSLKSCIIPTNEAPGIGPTQNNHINKLTSSKAFLSGRVKLLLNEPNWRSEGKNGQFERSRRSGQKTHGCCPTLMSLRKTYSLIWTSGKLTWAL